MPEKTINEWVSILESIGAEGVMPDNQYEGLVGFINEAANDEEVIKLFVALQKNPKNLFRVHGKVFERLLTAAKTTPNNNTEDRNLHPGHEE